ncbi:hypothetical protein FLGE108171_05565 [Flavobacterium gelidilacus]|uniref:hypothetical protein n=1 Tax=Flavobacterium gelidilacus TaxID=206041 RepID=UPI000426CD02|nr:hypothetical protein [Flavobacterium gelidilacus]
MKQQDSLTKKISEITAKIQTEYPELIKYLDEIPRNFHSTGNGKVSQKALQDYLNSLNDLLKTYAKEH